MRRGVGLLAAALAAGPAVAGAAGPARAAGPPCTAAVALEPSHAYVGQLVVYRVEIGRERNVADVEWVEQPSFPSFRASWLPHALRPPTAEGVQRSEERRALFPARPGVLEIPPARLLCREGLEEYPFAVPATRLVVEPVPEVGRPPGFEGVVGPVQVKAWVDPAEVGVGGSVQLSVSVEGPANLWVLDSPLPPLPGLEVFAHPASLDFDPSGAGQTPALRVRRRFRYDLVARAPGAFTIPPLRVPWFDPASGRFEVAGSEALAFGVSPIAPRGHPRARAGEDARDAAGGASRGGAALVGAALALAVLALLAVLVGRRRRAAPQRAARRALRSLWAEADAARAAGDTDAERRALERALRARLAAGPAETAEELRAETGDDAERGAAVELLAALERARFAPGAPSVEPERLRAVLRALARSGAGSPAMLGRLPRRLP